ncbi:hypothetical protein PF005_g5639 [Phytophthora fragariae]|uniref:Membrane-associated protein n=1 Tax=Phytophthora fragariae TaxID=53985 RepID=A0A6A3ZX94_9STRA|nr:hypothetical protein PF003_g33463 [Phytophthora fragariae]KAE9022130.1 hypothetical protein PF011_g4619 [Phytophthora fragariae]KAE9153950.1 hypothetical protein PF006_g1964 [Phytophthora fragariae]KAE9225154.1 hypothetical protein PF005_g5639 [Phytophthora fragariae]KAE9245940.1 hypothetical protein PF004_g5032 [Phytophthora fragariae]
MGLCRVSPWLALLLSGLCRQVCGTIHHEDAAAEPIKLAHVLDAEIDATRQHLELYKRKAELLGDTLHQLETQLRDKNKRNGMSPEAFSGNNTATQQRRQRSHESPQIFSDWFEHRASFSFSSLGASGTNSSQVLTQLVSFRPNTSPMGRKQQTAMRRRTNVDDDPPLQFVLVLDPRSTVMSFFHPTTHEVMWQHALNLRSSSQSQQFQVADMFFVSDRSSYFAVLSTSGDLALFKLRLWHSRRVVSGDTRRLKPLRELDENRLQCAVGQDSLTTLDPSLPPWLQPSSSSLTVPASGRYLHVDVERIFETTVNPERSYERGKIAVVAQYYHVFVVASDSSGRHLTFYNGDNGTFIKDIHTQASPHGGGAVQLEPIPSGRGLVALATQNRVFFVDATNPLLVPVMCKAPGLHTFASLAADPVRSSIVYAGTSTGRALVFKLHNFGAWRQRSDFSDQSPRGPVMCALVGQLMPRQLTLPASGTRAPVVVQTMPGFLVLGSGSQLVLYQLSGSSDEARPTFLSEYSLAGSFVHELSLSAQHMRIVGVSAAKDLLVHSTGLAVLVAVPSSTGDHLQYQLNVYESRIPPPGTNIDLSWIRVPAMMVCALAAMFWQQKGRLAYSAGGRSAFNEAELAGILSGRGGRLPSMGAMKRSGMNTNRRASDWY